MKNKRTFKHNQDIAAWFGRNFKSMITGTTSEEEIFSNNFR